MTMTQRNTELQHAIILRGRGKKVEKVELKLRKVDQIVKNHNKMPTLYFLVQFKINVTIKSDFKIRIFVQNTISSVTY